MVRATCPPRSHDQNHRPPAPRHRPRPRGRRRRRLAGAAPTGRREPDRRPGCERRRTGRHRRRRRRPPGPAPPPRRSPRPAPRPIDPGSAGRLGAPAQRCARPHRPPRPVRRRPSPARPRPDRPSPPRLGERDTAGPCRPRCPPRAVPGEVRPARRLGGDPVRRWLDLAWHAPAWPTSRPRRKVTPDTAFSVASVSKTFTAALILGLVEDGRMLPRRLRADLPADAPDRSRDHRPPAAGPHQRPARLLLRRGRRQGPPEQARPGLGPGPLAQVPRQAVRPAGHGVALLQHELPDPRHARRARRRRPRGGAAPGAVLRSARARPHDLSVVDARRRARWPAATGSSARTRSSPPSTCPTGPRSCRSPRS